MMGFNLKTNHDNEMEIIGKWKVCSFTAGTSYFSGGSRCPILEFFPKGNGVYNKDLRFNYLINGDTLKIIPLQKTKNTFFYNSEYLIDLTLEDSILKLDLYSLDLSLNSIVDEI